MGLLLENMEKLKVVLILNIICINNYANISLIGIQSRNVLIIITYKIICFELFSIFFMCLPRFGNSGGCIKMKTSFIMPKKLGCIFPYFPVQKVQTHASIVRTFFSLYPFYDEFHINKVN